MNALPALLPAHRAGRGGHRAGRKKNFDVQIFKFFWIATSPITSPSNLQRAGNRAGSNLKTTSPMKKTWETLGSNSYLQN